MGRSIPGSCQGWGSSGRAFQGLRHWPAAVAGAGAMCSGGPCSPDPSMLGPGRSMLHTLEEGSGNRRSVVMAALLAQKRLKVFCIYLLFSFLKKECSCGHLVSLSGMCVCSRVSPFTLCPGRGHCELRPKPKLSPPRVGLSFIRGLLVGLL